MKDRCLNVYEEIMRQEVFRICPPTQGGLFLFAIRHCNRRTCQYLLCHSGDGKRTALLIVFYWLIRSLDDRFFRTCRCSI